MPLIEHPKHILFTDFVFINLNEQKKHDQRPSPPKNFTYLEKGSLTIQFLD